VPHIRANIPADIADCTRGARLRYAPGHYFPSGMLMTDAPAQRLADLYRVHWKGLCGYVRAQFGPGPPEPEDVAQAAFIRFAAADPSHIENPRAFLYATARHLVIDHHRQAQRASAHEHATQSAAAENPLYELSPENVLLQAERFRILARALERMPLKRRRLVLLNRFEGLSYAQIGEQFGMSAENVRKHIERTLAECLRALHE
jgi:RNA polymerase sigma-70 factor (ECF subfamily)